MSWLERAAFWVIIEKSLKKSTTQEKSLWWEKQYLKLWILISNLTKPLISNCLLTCLIAGKEAVSKETLSRQASAMALYFLSLSSNERSLFKVAVKKAGKSGGKPQLSSWVSPALCFKKMLTWMGDCTSWHSASLVPTTQLLLCSIFKVYSPNACKKWGKKWPDQTFQTLEPQEPIDRRVSCSSKSLIDTDFEAPYSEMLGRKWSCSVCLSVCESAEGSTSSQKWVGVFFYLSFHVAFYFPIYLDWRLSITQSS